MKQAEVCPHCGASMKRFWHRLTPGMVRALAKSSQFVFANNKNEFHLYKDLVGDNKLTTVEQMNWTKLRFHGLVAKKKNYGKWKRGYWVITKRGFEFLNGKISIPEKVQTFRNRVTDHDPKLVNIEKVLGSLPYFDSEYDYSYATSGDAEVVQPEKSAQGYWDFSSGSGRWIEK